MFIANSIPNCNYQQLAWCDEFCKRVISSVQKCLYIFHISLYRSQLYNVIINIVLIIQVIAETDHASAIYFVSCYIIVNLLFMKYESHMCTHMKYLWSVCYGYVYVQIFVYNNYIEKCIMSLVYQCIIQLSHFNIFSK